MLAIEIPKVDARKSAENELAEAILREMEMGGKCASVEYYHSGIAQGNWACRGKKGTASVEIIWAVARAFRDRGYVVNDKMYSGGNLSKLFISK